MPSASSSGSVPPASSDGRRANGGHINSGRAAKAARSRGCGLGHGTPSAVSSLFQPAPAAAPSVQLAMLAKARDDVHSLRLQVARARSALEASEEGAARLRRDLAKLQQWAVSQAALEVDTLPSPHKRPELLGTGYTPTERLRTIWNHFHRAFDAVTRIRGGDHKKQQSSSCTRHSGWTWLAQLETRIWLQYRQASSSRCESSSRLRESAQGIVGRRESLPNACKRSALLLHTPQSWEVSAWLP